MEVTVKINDDLQSWVDGAVDEVKDLFLSFLKQNPDVEDAPDYNDLDYDGSVHEIINGAVPIYTKDIEDTWYLHRNELEEAYENEGFGENPLENNGMAAIYCYLHQQVYEKFDANYEDWFDEWKEENGDADDEEA